MSETEGFQADLSPEQERVVNHIRARQMMRTKDSMGIGSFATDEIDGLVPNLQKGALGLIKVAA
jgi:flavine halogenase